MKAAGLVILALLVGGCAGRSLNAQQVAGIDDVDVIVGAFQSVPFVKMPPPPDPPKRPPIDTSGGVGRVVSQLVANASADVSASAAEDRRQQAVASRFSSFVRAMGTYDFAPDMLAAAKNELAAVRTIKLEVRPPPLTSRAELRSIYERSSASAVLYFDVEYSFRQLYDIDYVLDFEATAVLLPRTERLKHLRPQPDNADPLADGNAFYRRRFASSFKYRTGDDVPAKFRQVAKRLAADLARDLNRAR
ncbi:hypothetical protein [Reyranella sp.]|uniref:hypothetical protein n=1 Tax=Reyranella sp. TaxID=1929291 RepID=UPI003BAA34A7